MRSREDTKAQSFTKITLCFLRVFVLSWQPPISLPSTLTSAALFSPWKDRAQPVAAVRIVGRAPDFAEGLPADGLQISEPRFVDEIIARAVFEQFSIGELILPFDVKGLAPERIAP